MCAFWALSGCETVNSPVTAAKDLARTVASTSNEEEIVRKLVLALLACSLLPGAAAAAPQMQPVQHFQQKLTSGFYKGRTVRYLDFGPIKLAPGNRVAPIWVFTNGAKGQRNVIDVAPGDEGYSPLWQVNMVTWRGGNARVLRSAADVRKAVDAGEAVVKKTKIVVNCPVVGFNQKQTLGFAKDKTIAYLDLGAVKLRPGNKVAPIWAFTNGFEGQHNVIDVVPGDKDYAPLWRVNMLTWKDGASARLLTSATAIRTALAAGELTIRRTTMVVNCPVV
jgi:hypothetical protein